MTGDSDAGAQYLQDALLECRKYKQLADRAFAQLGEDEFFVALDAESNSIALIVKHMTGNMRSRWTDFLTTDGEKPDRNRDCEFELEKGDTKAALMERWERGWRLFENAIAALTPGDLSKPVYIRGEEHSMMQAINRQLTHYAYHVGQIVFLAKHFSGARWQSLSIPKGQSKAFDVGKDGGTRRF